MPEINPSTPDDFFGDYYAPLPAGDGVTPMAISSANGTDTSARDYWSAKRTSVGGASIVSAGARSVTPTISSATQGNRRYSPAMRAEDVDGYSSTVPRGESRICLTHHGNRTDLVYNEQAQTTRITPIMTGQDGARPTAMSDRSTSPGQQAGTNLVRRPCRV